MTLAARHVFGRAPSCDTPIRDASVSAEHAVLWWSDGTWWVKDLGSRNGTLLDASPTRAVRVPVVGKQLRFGMSTWDIVDTLPPTPRARTAGRLVEAMCPTVLGLPSATDPQTTIVADHDDWWVEDEQGRTAAHNGQVITVLGQPWTLELPPLRPAADGTTLTLTGFNLFAARLVLTVSLDQEHVDLEIHSAGVVHAHTHHAHHDLVRALAVQRLADAAAGLPASEQGWVTSQELLRELRLTRRTLAVHVFRTRKMFAAAGIDNASDAIQRRIGTASMRLGLSHIEMM